MNWQQHVAADCRLIILKALADENDNRLNETNLVHVLKSFGHTKSREYVRTQMRFLESLDAVRITEAGTVLIAELRQAGESHLTRENFLEGVLKPSVSE